MDGCIEFSGRRTQCYRDEIARLAKELHQITYCNDYTEEGRLAAGHIDRILKGAKPADLPIQLPTAARHRKSLRAGKRMTMETTAARGRKLLEQCALFAGMDERSRRELVALAVPRNFGVGEPICRLGDVGLSMMAVVTGTVRITLPMPKGKEIILADLPAGELFGEIAMLDGKPRSADATALTKCELLVLERRHVIPFLEQNPPVCLKLMEMLCARIRHSDERMADIAFFDLPTRLAKVLLNYPAKTRDDTRLSLSQRELAEMAGGTRENVNRCLRDWQRRGIVESKGGWTIIRKADELRRLASGSSNETAMF